MSTALAEQPGRGPAAERVIEAIAARQHGVVARGQLLEAGLSTHVLDRRVRSGRLRPLHRGVYGVGPIAGALARETAAVLAAGDGALISHRSAAGLWEMLPRHDADPVDVTVVRGRAGQRPGLRVHHVRTLRADEATAKDGIPVCTVARTLFDLACAVSERELERALAECLALRLVQPPELAAVLAQHPGRPGSDRLRRMIQGEAPVARTRSEAEERFLALVRRARIPEPAANTVVAGHEVDFLWHAERLVIEVDGRAFHSAGGRFESDRRRDADLIAAGLRVMRVTWRQIVREPEALLVRLAQALARPAP